MNAPHWTHRRQQLAILLASKPAEVVMLVLVVVYGALIVTSLALSSEGRNESQDAFDIADMAFTWWFAAELCLRALALGSVMFKSPWNVLDAVVILVSLVAAMMATTVKSIILLRFLRLRVLLRLFPCLLVLGRLRRTAAGARAAVFVVPAQDVAQSNKPILTTPLERCLTVVQAMIHGLHLSDQQLKDLQFVAETLRNGDLYQPEAQQAQHAQDSVDHQTDAWFRSEFAVSVMGKSTEAEVDDGEDAAASAVSTIVPHVEVQPAGRGPSPTARAHRNLREVQRLKSMRVEERIRGQSFRAQLRLLEAMSQASLVHDENNVANIRPGSVNQGVTAAAHAKLWNLALRNVRLRRLLKSVNSWYCNIFSAVEITYGHALYVLTYNLTHVHGLVPRLRLDAATLARLLGRIESGYLVTNPYHNALHAADVVQTTNYFLSQPALFPFLQPVDILSALLAAAAHDYAHPGVNNSFECATRTPRSIVYNDVSVLENMHASALFTLMTVPELNVLAPLTTDEYKRARHVIIALILGTDMAKHFEDMTKFKAKLSAITPATETCTPEVIATVADATFFLQMALHTADVSNPAKPLTTCRQWVHRVVTEFYQQGDKERELGLPISAFFDRTAPNVPKLQMSFIDFIVQPLFTEWSKVSHDVATRVLPLLHTNRRYWDVQSKRPAHTAVPIHEPAPHRTSHTFSLAPLTLK